MRFRRRSIPQPIAIREVLSRWLKRQKMDQELHFYTICARWRELVGDRLAARTQPHQLKGGCLTIKVASSAWLNELSFVRMELVQRINRALGSGLITSVRLLSGTVRPLAQRSSERQTPPVETELSAEICREAENEVNEIQDPLLREAVLRARLSQLRLQKRLRPRG
jgi:predicted nucleic acid-binding Zn ribbon protein